MPTINIEILEGRTRQQKTDLVRRITDVACEVLGIEPETVNIRILELKRDSTARGGRFFSEAEEVKSAKQ